MDATTAQVVGEWFDLCHRAGVRLDAASGMAQLLVDAYGETHRRYHDLTHVQHCLRLLGEVDLDEPNRIVAELAVWFHDAVYEPARDDNEARSAALAATWMHEQGLASGSVVAIIAMTAGHRLGSGADVATRAVHDVDLAILGAAPDDYDAYAAGIRAEYRHLDDGAYRSGRRAALERLLALDPLYSLARFRTMLEPRARDNMTREVHGLRLTPT